MAYNIALVPGDGIGPEITEATVRVLSATGVPIEWTWLEAGAEVTAKYGEPMPEPTLNAIRRLGIALKGPITTPIGKGFRSANVALRQALDLYAAVRPSKTIPGVITRYDNVNITVIRENTEGLYSGIEHLVVPGVAESIKVMTDKACTRISRFAFEHARKIGATKVTVVHKANIMKISDGLFLECFRKIAREYPEIEAEEIIIDNLCMQLVRDPTRFQVLVMENLYGDIISDLCSGMVGGLGVVPGANIGDHAAVFEAVHGSAPDIAGKGLANPTALILSAGMMLDHIGETDAADRVRNAVEKVLGAQTCIPRDMGGTANTKEYTDALIGAMA
ncbi:MAG TPA: isocitrate/isopropylmalate dehydrogenase family protein [Armatimonadota bacterium]|nr:isocitrate/isopropylmalate dehydrogenase family protein [Armatimonadota bacterium]